MSMLVTADCNLTSFCRLRRSAIDHRRQSTNTGQRAIGRVVSFGEVGAARPYGLHTDLCLILAGGLLAAVRPHEGEAALLVAEVQLVAVGVPVLLGRYPLSRAPYSS